MFYNLRMWIVLSDSRLHLPKVNDNWNLILNDITKGFDKTRIKCEDYNYQVVEISIIIDGYFNLGDH
jgi:hypothetical protein